MATASSDLGRRGFVLKPLHMIGIAIIVLAIVLGYYGLQSGLRPYTTSVSEAISTGRGVQLAGFLYPGETGAYDKNGEFTFKLQDSTGKVVQVVYRQAQAGQLREGDQHCGDRPL